ncbi:16S rRNA (cytosine(967)-C(5))-methyltransferase RsmB [Limosilactobacillus sp.]|jgi:16S rRNA (cytosine967-C5)-methyltransferase|uniref:16S rRNA (cytosine(967)-C(5))-methyltransferase RsmB n=3 Tax=Limosilactobacillus sp. TaxID=2773925 RepID=UPI0025B91AB7|nr:16S rRNA (cytosine(967)-C(5))-methyltransferase RsmB [Limosilactobacillus sp.]MCI2031389.1 16S rRNA (cytosine(967)-C(5))-methyltransferase RsmB [Limosilactobacillus sp.]
MTKFIPQNARELAFTSLERVLKTGAYSNLQVDETLRHHNLSSADRRLVTTIVYGTLQHQLTLKYWLDSLTRQKKLDSWVEALLMTALYQYHYLDRFPNWAITNETIEIAKHRGNPGIRKFVTGVLHAALRKGFPDFSKVKKTTERLSLESSVPQWLVEKFVQQYGMEKAKDILHAINMPAHVSIRINTNKSDLATVKEQLLNEGVETTESKVAANALVVTSGTVVNSSLLRNGTITIQDESAMLAVESMDLQPQFKVLDACAAPGGKTVQIAERLSADRGGQVVALDIHKHKVRLIKKNALRMGVNNVVSPVALDARKVAEKFSDDEFDRILVDAPCSGIGLLRRKPEIRYTKTPHDSQNLHKIQLAILDAVAPKVKKGGIITFSTCTILQEENEQTVREFLQKHPDFKLERTKTARALKDDRATATLTILPSDYGSDGFFISSLKRNL